MTHYQKLIASIDPTCNPRHVEAWMRLQYGTLDHLPQESFIEEIASCKLAGELDAPMLEQLAASYGL